MYQWEETSSTRREGEEEITDYHYNCVWKDHRIDSANFFDKEGGYDNPTNEWPFVQETQTANYVQFGKYKLEKRDVDRLGKGQPDVDIGPFVDTILEKTDAPLDDKGFSQFICRDNVLFASTDDNLNAEAHVGQMRVWFRYSPCGQTAIMQQQMKNNEGQLSFREWNPKKRDVPWGDDVNGEPDKLWCDHPIACCICHIVNFCFKTIFEETVDVAQDGHVNPQEHFENQKGNVETFAIVGRIVGIICMILGNYLLFLPWIKLLNMIPFVGWLLSAFASIAAFIWSFFVGLNTAVFIIAVAWVFYRPLFGICMLIIFAAGIFFAFFFPWSKYFGDDEGGVSNDGGVDLNDDDFVEDDPPPAANSSSTGRT